MSYCQCTRNLEKDNIHRVYHDTQYGFPIHDDNELFGRLILEINQAGLSWNTILNKAQNFRKAYTNYDIAAIAHYSEKDQKRLMNNAGIIRNKLKIKAAIYNARVVLNLQKEYGSFEAWLNYHHPKNTTEWVELFKQVFKFTGGEITKEFLMSTGYLEGAHIAECETYEKIMELQPKWMQKI